MQHLKLRYRTVAPYILLTVTLLCASWVTKASEIAFPLIRNYSSNEYAAHPTNYEVAQDKQGVMYFANGDGLLEFNGTKWSLYRTQTGKAIHSLDIADDGKIYVGSNRDFGYFSRDTLGSLVYQSLLDEVAEEHRNFKDITQTFSSDKGIFFLSSRKIFRYKEGEITVWTPELSLFEQHGFWVNNELYINEMAKGLRKLEGEEFVNVPGSESIVNEQISAILPMDDGQLLICTKFSGLFTIKDGKFQRFTTNIESFLTEDNNRVTNAIKLKDNTYGIATLEKGMSIIDENGQLVQLMNMASGLQNDHLIAAFLDQQNGLWLTTDDGISRVEIYSPIYIFRKNSGIDGDINDIVRHAGTLFVATNQALHYLVNFDTTRLEESNFVHHSYFKFIPFFQLDHKTLLSTQGQLLVGNSDGVFKMFGNDPQRIAAGNVNILYKMKSEADVVLAGTTSKLLILRYRFGRWEKYPVIGINDNVIGITEQGGNIWLATAKGIIKINASTLFRPPVQFKRYTINEGLPYNKGNFVYNIDNQLIAATERGLFAYNSETDRFERSDIFGVAFNEKERKILDLEKGRGDTYYVFTDVDRGVAVKTDDGTYEYRQRSYNRIADATYAISYLERAKNVLWYGGSQGLLKVDLNKVDNMVREFYTIINKVSLEDNEVLFDGALSAVSQENDVANLSHFKPVLPFNQNTIRFDFSAATFDYSGLIEYQYKLEGLNDSWSPWIKEPKIEFNNLTEGVYNFHVRSRNSYGFDGFETSYPFTIAKPWYKTFWALALWIACGALLVYLIIVLWSRKLRSDKRKLESVVAERTADLEKSKKEVEDSLVKLKATQERMVEQQKLASLGQLTAGIAHEIKNPLNFVNNFAELSAELVIEVEEELDGQKDKLDDEVLEDVNEILGDLKKNVEKINEHGKRADNIVKSMLMHSRARKDEKEPVDINMVLEDSINLAYRGLRGKNSDIVCQFEKDFQPDLKPLHVVKQDISRVLLNIINNAVYAANKKRETDDSFEPRVSVTTHLNGSQMVEIHIKDNGIGISTENLEKIFNPFFTTKPTGEGTGLGLSISHDIIVKGHDGELQVNSEEGNYTEFIIKLPMN